MRALIIILTLTMANAEGITGIVLGPDGEALPRCVVVATSAGRAVGQATTSRNGEYQLTLPSGSYDVSITFPALRAFEKKGVHVADQGIIQLDAKLEYGGQLGTPGEGHEYSMGAARRVAPPGVMPRTKDGTPDFTGIWTWPFPVDMGNPNFLPAAQAVAKQRSTQGYKDAPEVLCQGHHLLWSNPRIEMVQTSAVLILMYEDEEPGFRQVFLDGRGHPMDLNPTWTGHAVGTWEGDTLVVDRTGFNDRAWLDGDGHPHSEKLHIVERYRRPDFGHLLIEITVEDPEVLVGKWTLRKESILSANDAIQEYLCSENNLDLGHIVREVK